MARATNRLSARTASTLKKPGRHGDHGGLYLSVSPDGSHGRVSDESKAALATAHLVPSVSVRTGKKLAREHSGSYSPQFAPSILRHEEPRERDQLLRLG